MLSWRNGKGRKERLVERGDIADLKEVAHPSHHTNASRSMRFVSHRD